MLPPGLSSISRNGITWSLASSGLFSLCFFSSPKTATWGNIAYGLMCCHPIPFALVFMHDITLFLRLGCKDNNDMLVASNGSNIQCFSLYFCLMLCRTFWSFMHWLSLHPESKHLPSLEKFQSCNKCLSKNSITSANCSPILANKGALSVIPEY